jgi:FkbM family methyltransferase
MTEACAELNTRSNSSTCAELEALLDRDIESETSRERSWYDRLTQDAPDLVLFGAGNHGRHILRCLRKLTIEPVGFADNNASLWGKTVEGLPVFSPAEASQRYGRSASFLITIFSHGTGHSFAAFRHQLEGLGCTRVVPFAALAWKHPDLFLPDYCLDLPHRVIKEADAVRNAYALWADEPSRQEFLDQLRWRLNPDGAALPPPSPEEPYFPGTLVSLRDDEVFVDCGAFDGDTVRSFLNLRGERFGQVIAFEPDPANFGQLARCICAMPSRIRKRFELHQAGVGLRREKVRFVATGNMGAAISASGEMEIDCVSLDEALAGRAPTYLKMDIEGAEPHALAGSAHVIGKHAPALAICVYHRQDHLWRIPLLIQALHQGYEFYLRRYQEECWDVVCYAIPRSRLTLAGPG